VVLVISLVKKLVMINEREREREGGREGGRKKPSPSSQAQTARITKCLGLALMLKESRLLGLTPVAKKSSFLGQT